MGRRKQWQKINYYLLVLGIIGVVMLLYTSSSWAFRPRSPEEAIDKHIAQLQPKILNRNELSELEKEEIKKYGYTGLELMTYFVYRGEPGTNCADCISCDNQGFARVLLINRRGHIRNRLFLWRWSCHYPDFNAQHELDPSPEFPVGTQTNSALIMLTEPPYVRGTTQLGQNYLETWEKQRDDDQWLWLPNLRRIRKLSAADKEDGLLGTDITNDDYGSRKPFEEDHRIMAEDKFGEWDCFVVESRSKFPDYYTPRRMTWITKKTFLNVHEEQFDRMFRLFKVMDRYWHQVKPWGEWARYVWAAIDLSSGHRSHGDYIDRTLDVDYPDSFFTFRQLEKEEIFATLKNPLPEVKSVSELPPPPQVKLDFWKKMGETPEVVK